MFSGELVLEEYPSFFEQAEKIMEDLLEDDAALLQNDATTPKATIKKQRSGAVRGKKNEDINDESKKIMHRETERHRRQEMSALYTSLRSLLPPQYVKGKRAVCDHMHEAVNYIKHLQKNIKELQIRRDKLKKLSTNLSGTKICRHDSPSYVTVNRCEEGLEILISCSNADGSPLSRVLVELLGRGLNPVTLDSTRINQNSLHKIHTQASDHIMTSVDSSELQNRLTDIVKLS